MDATVERVDLAYEAAFAVPSFDLPVRGTALLKALYETISPRYPIPTTQMQIFGGNAMSDVRVRITLFNGNGTIEVIADKMILNFNDIRGKEGIAICKDCILYSERALAEAIPEISVRFVTIRPTFLVNVNAENDQEIDFLSGLGGSFRFKISELDGTSQHSGVNLSVENAGEGWNAIFHIFHNQAVQKSYFLSCHAQYEENGTIQGLENKEYHIKQLLDKFARGIGLEIPNFSEEMTTSQ